MNYSERNSNDSNEYSTIESKLLEPCLYIHQIPRRWMLEKFINAFNHWMKIPDNKILDINDIARDVYNACVLIDDIEDNSKLRRGSPVAHSIYGIPHTINAANYTMIKAVDKSLKLNHPDATKVCVEQILALHRGQGMDMYWRDTYTCPSEEEYKKMIVLKTGSLYKLLIGLMQIFSENKTDFTNLAHILGSYIQVHNDYSNFCYQDYEDKKGYCEDLTEGKFSFPIIHAIHNQPNDNQIMSILRQRTIDRELKRHCVSLLERFGSLEYTRQILTELDLEVRKEIEILGGNPLLEAVIDEILSWNTGKLVKESYSQNNV